MREMVKKKSNGAVEMITSNPGIKCCFCEEDLSKNKLADNNAWMNQNKWKVGR